MFAEFNFREDKLIFILLSNVQIKENEANIAIDLKESDC